MAIKVTDIEGTPTKTVSYIDLDLGSLDEKTANQVKEDVGQFIVEQILLTVADAKSPIKGEKWPALNPQYKKIKERDGADPIANLELYGDMLNELTFESTDEGIAIGFFDTDQAWIADGHVKFSGEENNTPQRRFLPDVGDEFIGSIQTGIERIIADAQTTLFSKQDFEDIKSATQLYDELRTVLGDLSDSELRLAAIRNGDLYDMLDELDLTEYL